MDVFFVGPRAGLHCIERGAVNTKIWAFVSFTDQTLQVSDVVLEDRDPSLLVMLENILQVVLLVRHLLQMQFIGHILRRIILMVLVATRNDCDCEVLG